MRNRFRMHAVLLLGASTMTAIPAIAQQATPPQTIRLLRPFATPTPTPSATPTPAATPVPIRVRPAPSVTPAPTTTGRPAPLVLRPTPVPVASPAPNGRPPVISRPMPVQPSTPTGPVVFRPTPTPTPGPIKPVGQLGIAKPILVQTWDGNPTTIIPPSGLALKVRPSAVTLRPGSYADISKTLPGRKSFTGAALRSAQPSMIGKLRIDFRPILNDPKSLPNVAQRLRRMPQLVQLRGDVVEAMEIQQGLVIRSVLTYNLRPGACRDGVRRAQIAAAGIRCFTPTPDAQRWAGYANPSDPRYVADPVMRAQAVAQAKQQSVQITADIAQSVGNFRAQMMSCPRLSGPSTMIVWITKGTTNA